MRLVNDDYYVTTHHISNIINISLYSRQLYRAPQLKRGMRAASTFFANIFFSLKQIGGISTFRIIGNKRNVQLSPRMFLQVNPE